MSGLFVQPTWAVLELYGHRRLGGLVSEIEQFGGKMCRIDIPSVSEPGTFATQTYGEKAIYGCHPVTEEVAREVARYCQPAPPTPLRQLSERNAEDEDEHDEHDEAEEL